MRKFIILIFATYWLVSCTKQTEVISCIEGTVNNEIVLGSTSALSNLMDWSKANSYYYLHYNNVNRFNLRLSNLNINKCDIYEIDLNNLPLNVGCVLADQ